MTFEIDYHDYQKALHFEQRISKMPALQQLTRVLIDELDPQDGDRILDVGTGTGRVGMALANIVPRGLIVGIDSGYGMLKVAKEKVSASRIGNLFLVRGEAETISFLPHVFDRACLMLSFHHFSDPEKAIKEIYQTLRTKGYLVSVDPVLKEAVQEEEKRLNQLIEEAFQLAHGPQFRFFTTEELRVLYQRAGFSIENVHSYDFPFHQRGIEEVPMGAHWLQAYELLCSQGKKSLVERFEQNYFSFGEREGQLLVKGKMTWAIIKAIKGSLEGPIDFHKFS